MAEEAVPRTGSEVAELLAVDETFRERLIEIARTKFQIDRDTAEDLLQETTVILIRQDVPIRKPDGFTYRVFYTRCCHFLETQAGRRKVLSTAPPLRPKPPRDTATDLDLAIALKQGLSRLSPMCRELLRGHYWEGRPLEETARVLALAESSGSTLVSRCLDRLRRIVSCVKP